MHAQAILVEFQQRTEHLAAQLDGDTDAQLSAADQLAAHRSGGSQGSAAGYDTVLSANCSRPATAQAPSFRAAAASCAELKGAGDATELQQAAAPRTEAADGETEALPDAEGERSGGDGAESCADRGSAAGAAFYQQAAAGRVDELADVTALLRAVAERHTDDGVDDDPCEPDADSAGAGTELACERTTVEATAPVAAIRLGMPSGAAADVRQDERASQRAASERIRPGRGSGADVPGLHAHGSQLLPEDLTVAGAREHGAGAPNVAGRLALGATVVEEVAGTAADVTTFASEAAAEVCQDEVTTELVPLPWVGPQWHHECTPASAVRQHRLSAHIALADNATARHDDARMPVPMVSVCSSPPSRRPVKRARRCEPHGWLYAMKDGSVDGYNDPGQGSGPGCAVVSMCPSDDASRQQAGPLPDETLVQQACAEDSLELRRPQQVPSPSPGPDVSDAMLTAAHTLTERLEGLSGLVMGQGGGSKDCSQNQPVTLVSTALQGAARYVPWDRCSPP